MHNIRMVQCGVLARGKTLDSDGLCLHYDSTNHVFLDGLLSSSVLGFIFCERRAIIVLILQGSWDIYIKQ